MKCQYCKGTGKYREPKDKQEFDRLIDTEMEKGYFITYGMAEEKAYKEVGYTVINCPYCTSFNRERNE